MSLAVGRQSSSRAKRLQQFSEKASRVLLWMGVICSAGSAASLSTQAASGNCIQWSFAVFIGGEESDARWSTHSRLRRDAAARLPPHLVLMMIQG